MSLQTDIERYLRSAKVGADDLARDFQSAHDLILYGETHVGLSKKALFFAKIIRAGQVRYHASEHFLNTKSYGRKVEGYLTGKHGTAGLPSRVRSLSQILDAIKPAVQTKGLVFSGSNERNTQRRHIRIHANFKSSRSLHLNAGRFTAGSKGHFHIGAFHASRLPQEGSTKTTTQRLIADGFSVGVVRLMVDVTGSSSETTGGGLTITAGEGAWVVPVAGGSSFDLLPILRRVAGGTSFGVDVKTPGKPFWKIKPDGITSSNAWPDYYDKLIFLA